LTQHNRQKKRKERKKRKEKKAQKNNIPQYSAKHDD
jgi:hypothetical protein